MVLVTSKAISNVSSSLIGSPFLVQKYSTGGPPLVSARRLNSGELPVNVDAEATIATLFPVITPAPAAVNMDPHYTLLLVTIETW